MTTQPQIGFYIVFSYMLYRSDGFSFLSLLLIAQGVSQLSCFSALSERASVTCGVWGDFISAG